MNCTHLFSVGLLFAATTLAAPVLAHDYSQGDIHIEHPWSRPTPPGTPMGVGYMIISNHGNQDVTLTSAQSPRAGNVSIHETHMHDGVMRMNPVKGGLVIPAGETVELKPHSYHLMLEKLTEPLAEGELISLELAFDGAEDMAVELEVHPLDGKEKAVDHSGMHHH